MKKSNEFITLRLYSVEQALGLVNCLFDNGYLYRNNVTLTYDILQKDIIKIFNYKSKKKDCYDIYLIEIDNEIKEYGIICKSVDILDARKYKISAIKNKILK